MTRDDVIRMAREAGFQTGLAHDRDGNVSYTFAKFQGENCLHGLEVFASLVAAAEREACAKVCETAEVPIAIDVWMGTKKELTASTAIGLAAAIRARGT